MNSCTLPATTQSLAAFGSLWNKSDTPSICVERVTYACKEESWKNSFLLLVPLGAIYIFEKKTYEKAHAYSLDLNRLKFVA